MSITYDATYSPEDNKLRLRASARLDKELYDRVRTHGFIWAPKQDLFVAPMWTPERADFLIELCGEIGDEDTSLVERAEERADRFEGYHENRKADAEAAHDAVKAIADNIPLGQPILVGHHSEKHARRDAEKIKSGMAKAVKMWDTAEYWMRRAKGAVRAAKYKERPDVRHRRIKRIEADLRKVTKEREHAANYGLLWSKTNLTREMALSIANYDRVIVPGSLLNRTDGHGYFESMWSALDKNLLTLEQAVEVALAHHQSISNRAKRWSEHYENRLAYERAMLGEVGGIVADKFPIEVGGRVLCSGWQRKFGYLVVMRVTKKDDAIVSVRTPEGLISVEDIEDYKAPEGDDAEKVKAATKLPPLVNYPGESFRHMTKADFDKVKRHSDMYSIRRMKATEKHGAHRLRHAPKEGRPYYDITGVYLTDQKRVDPPAPVNAPAQAEAHAEALVPVPAPVSLPPRTKPRIERNKFDDMRDSLKAGVVTVAADQLFPTPFELAKRMVALADVQPGLCVLEPSAGTGNIVRAILDAVDTEVLAYEINQSLCSQLSRTFPSYKLQVRCRDFLTVEEFAGQYRRIVMNPPFADMQDAKHILHAWRMLAVGGVLVSIASAAVKFRTTGPYIELRELIEIYGTMEDLPDDTFKAQGTSVRTVLITLRK